MVPQGLCVTPSYILVSAYSYDDEINDSAKKELSALAAQVAHSNKKTMVISYEKVIPVDCQASTLGYDSVNKRLWVAKYNDLGKDAGYSYEVTKDAKGEISLKKHDKITVPRHTQGMAFKGNKLLIVTSCNKNTSNVYVYNWNERTILVILRFMIYLQWRKV